MQNIYQDSIILLVFVFQCLIVCQYVIFLAKPHIVRKVLIC